MANRNLLIDIIPFEISPQQLQEAMTRPNGKFIVKGTLQISGVKNQNGRIYPHAILEREVHKYKSSYIKERRAMGELDHPDSSIINLNNVSHNVIDAYWDNNKLVGIIEILGTPAGNILKELFKAGIKLGISSRGLGSVERDGDIDEVQEDYELICWDFVSNPSTPGAFMHAVNEGKDNNKKEIYSSVKCGKWCKIQSLTRTILGELK